MTRARDIRITIGSGLPGPNNAITDVSGVRVGTTTLIRGEDVRTGVTMIVPFGGTEPLFASFHRLNGNGEMTGIHIVREFGLLTSPVAITNAQSVGTVHTAIVAHSVRAGFASSGFAAW